MKGLEILCFDFSTLPFCVTRPLNLGLDQCALDLDQRVITAGEGRGGGREGGRGEERGKSHDIQGHVFMRRE